MKANEAPEKIYLTTFGFPICEPIPQDSSNPDTVWSEKPYTGADSIKYTRTDAFIKKVRKWFERQNEWRDINGIKHCDMESFEDFKNYMEGE